MEIGLSPNFDITGTKWYHKTGKDNFVVREVIMDPSQGMIVLAEDGRTFSMDAMVTIYKPTNHSTHRNIVHLLLTLEV